MDGDLQQLPDTDTKTDNKTGESLNFSYRTAFDISYTIALYQVSQITQEPLYHPQNANVDSPALRELKRAIYFH